MAPSPIRQLLVWSLPSVAVLLSYLWYKKRRIGARSDTGGSKPIEESIVSENIEKTEAVNIVRSELESERVRAQSIPTTTRAKKYNRSLSGVETTPIDIVYPRDLKASKSSPVIISDEDLDLEIEKVKSMRNQYNSPSTISAHLSKTPSPTKAETLKTAESKYQQSSPDNTDNVTNPSTSPEITAPKKESFEHSPTNHNNNNIKVTQTNNTQTPKTTPKKNKGKNNKEKKQEKPVGKKMAQKDVKAVEEKMTALKVSNNKESQKKETASKTTEKENNDKNKEQNRHNEVHRKNSGRDSANHSPSDVMMASPSLSSMSDNHSEGSSDSGKGGSDVATPPPSRTPQLNINPNMPTTYEFVIPIGLVGKLIGRQGCFVQSIKDKCNAHVYVRRHPSNNRLKLCSIEGTQAEVDKALKMIRDKFPPKKYSEVTLEQVQLTPLVSTVPLIPDCLYLKLIEGINNDTILSCMVTPDHLFMQQPTHPSFPSLNMLSNCMNNCYNAADSPLLPSPIPENTVCAALSIDSWYRAMVLATEEETDTSYVKFLDYGGYAYVENSKLRQIRQDFMLLPFQAAECFLANVKPKSEDGTWPEAAYNLVAEITKGSIIYTQVADYTPEGIPCVLCYVVIGPREVVFLNQRLVDEGHADWVPFEDIPPSTADQAQQQPQQPAEAVVA